MANCHNGTYWVKSQERSPQKNNHRNVPETDFKIDYIMVIGHMVNCEKFKKPKTEEKKTPKNPKKSTKKLNLKSKN